MESYALLAQFDNMFSGWVCPTLSAPENYKKNPFIDSIFFSIGAKPSISLITCLANI